MGWIPSRDHHGGLKEILETKQVPVGWCITDSEYIENLDTHVTGYMDKKRKMAAMGVEEKGDPVGGARKNTYDQGKTLTFDMGDSSVPSD